MSEEEDRIKTKVPGVRKDDWRLMQRKWERKYECESNWKGKPNKQKTRNEKKPRWRNGRMKEGWMEAERQKEAGKKGERVQREDWQLMQRRWERSYNTKESEKEDETKENEEKKRSKRALFLETSKELSLLPFFSGNFRFWLLLPPTSSFNLPAVSLPFLIVSLLPPFWLPLLLLFQFCPLPFFSCHSGFPLLASFFASRRLWSSLPRPAWLCFPVEEAKGKRTRHQKDYDMNAR